MFVIALALLYTIALAFVPAFALYLLLLLALP
jgi:hypothetical protein